MFTKEGDTYFGRGTTDDKGPALTALFGARAALDAGVPREHPLPLGDRGGGRLAELRRPRSRRSAPPPRTDVVVVSDTVWVSRGRPVAVRGPARAAARSSSGWRPRRPTSTRGTTGGVGAQPDRRAVPARLRDLRRAHRPREDPRLLRRRRASSRASEIEDFKASGFSVEGVHAGPRLQVDPHEGPAGGHEAALGDADVRDPRHRRRLHGPRASRRSCRRARS